MGKAVTLGVLGTVLGVEATLVGIVWSITYYGFAGMRDLTVLTQNLPIIFPGILEHPCIPASLNIHVGNLRDGLVWLTLILSVALALPLILTGIGLYGLIGREKKLGIISTAVGATTPLPSAALLLSGATMGGNTPTYTSLISPQLFTQYPTQSIILISGVPNINTPALWLGFAITGFAIIIFGFTLIHLRKRLEEPELSSASGVLAIVTGFTLFAGLQFLWAAFTTLSLTFILANLVFFQQLKQPNP
ncbi:MAG: hypothetical protein KIH08_06130 [Candidatus Freyarchaeota archaeon]|nr:hypothetical protein [Candidatus Jordarchaeia archaeon]MBS7268757.1 hypothetical protein [Candidatus Jordarchaeia archaeon]MBS7279586.1 hypothetical protein [Candidatus Jordarchaeia archaeon]